MPTDLPPTVHAPLARWARERGAQVALDDGDEALSFAALHAEVERQAAALNRAGAPAQRLVDPDASTLRQLVEFLALVASGRCAAVGDPDWPPAVRHAVQALLDALPSGPVGSPGPLTPFYIGFTSGSTGVPKGYRRHHRSWTESLRVALATFGPDAASTILAPGRLSHSLFLFGMLQGLWSGAGVVVQPQRQPFFSATRALQTLASGRTPCLVAVPSQLLMLVEHAARRQLAPIDAVRLVLISGAPWARQRTPELQALFPRARLIEFYGASETSFIAWQAADAATPTPVVGRPFAGVEVEIREPGDADGIGQIHVRSPMLFSDYIGTPDPATAAIREAHPDGDWLSVRDLGRLDADGRLWLHGRENRMLVTQGKNLFPEEVEAVLAAHPAVTTASVHGQPDALRGREVVAVLQPADGIDPAALPDARALADWCRARLEPYKVPRRWFVVEVRPGATTPAWPMTRSGKTDHAAIGAWLASVDDSVGQASAAASASASASAPTSPPAPTSAVTPPPPEPAWLRRLR